MKIVSRRALEGWPPSSRKGKRRGCDVLKGQEISREADRCRKCGIIDPGRAELVRSSPPADCFGFGGAVADENVKATGVSRESDAAMGCLRECIPAASCEREAV
jgi:hypothetical protein